MSELRFLPYGARGLLVEVDDATLRRRLEAALRAAPIEGVVEQVAGACTVLLHVDRPERVSTVRDAVAALDLAAISAPADADPVIIPVTYDGPDLQEVAAHLQISTEAVIQRHTGQLWTVEFVGFLPGFAYLRGAGPSLSVPRRASPRPRIAAGSVALAGDWSGVYPSDSPGGWQLIGRTSIRLFDPGREPAALLSPGARARFCRNATR